LFAAWCLETLKEPWLIILAMIAIAGIKRQSAA
jgi:hypothetical protein